MSKMNRTIFVVAGILLPNVLSAQGVAGEIESFRSVLDTLYDEMIPLIVEVALLALVGFSAGLILAYLMELRRRANSEWRW